MCTSIFYSKITSTNIYYKNLSPGAPEPLPPDLHSIYAAWDNVKIIHLVRDPLNCFLSMKSRSEMDGDVYKIASAWSGFNSSIRNYFEMGGNKENYHLLKFEDLVSDTKSQLQNICEFIGVEYIDKMVEGTDEYHGRNKNKNLSDLITSEEKEVLDALTKSERSQYY